MTLRKFRNGKALNFAIENISNKVKLRMSALNPYFCKTFGINTQSRSMQKEIELPIPPDFIHDEGYIKQQGAQKLCIPIKRIHGFRVHKRSIDARGRQVLYRIKVIFFIDEAPNLPTFISELKDVRD